MDMYIWDSYDPDEINEKIKYWVDMWDDLIVNYPNNTYGFQLINPQLIINDIIDEIENNRLQNKDLRKLYYQQLNEIMDNDPSIKKVFKDVFNVIRQNFNGNPLYLLHLCKVAKNIFINGTYFKETFQALTKVLSNNVWDDNDANLINILSQYLIIELLLKGYTLKTIKTMPKNLFAKYDERQYDDSRSILTTHFPINIHQTDYEHQGIFDVASYNDAIKQIIDNLDIETRLNNIYKYYEEKPRNLYVIYQIEGLKGNVDFTIGDVNFYSPNVKRYIKNTIGQMPFIDDEMFNNKLEQLFINAAAKIFSIDQNASVIIAQEKIEHTLDIIRLYNSTESKFEIAKDSYIIIDEQGDLVGSSSSIRGSVFDKWIYAIDFSLFEKTERYKEMLSISNYLIDNNNYNSDIIKILDYSLHWYRKAEESNNYEDKLLDYWIALEIFMDENIADIFLKDKIQVTKFNMCKELLPYFIITYYLYNVGWDLFFYLQNLYSSRQGTRRLLNISEELAKECNLIRKENGRIELKNIIQKLPLLINAIDRKVIRDRIEFANSFYTNSQFAKCQIEKQMNMIKDELLQIYRYRNKIVHNAHYDNTILPYYVQKIRQYTGIILSRIIKDHAKNNSLSLEQILLTKYINTKLIIDGLEKNKQIDFNDLNI